MEKMANALTLGVAVVHIGIMVAEMFPTSHPWLLTQLEDKLGFAPGQGVHASPIVRNAGLFNGFLAAGLIWGWKARECTFRIRAFFLVCVVIAGVFGAVTLPSPLTLWLQTLPASIALAINCLMQKKGLQAIVPDSEH